MYDEIVIIVALVETNFWYLFLFVLVCSGESITAWLFLDYVTRHLMRVGRLLKTKDCEIRHTLWANCVSICSEEEMMTVNY